MKKALILGALLLILLPAGLVLADVAFESTKVTTHAFPGPIDEIVVSSDEGDVELVPARGRAVEVRETRHYVFKEPTFERSVEGGVLTIEVRCKTSFATCFSDLRVSVPAGAKITVNSDSGDIEARGVDVAETELRSDSGDMELELLGRQPTLRAHADSGDLEIVARGARAVDAETDSGDVDLVTRDALEVEAQTDSGDVDLVTRALDVDARTDSGDVTVMAGVLPRRIAAGTDAGDVRVTVPPGEYAVSTKTDSGDIKIGAEISRNDRATAVLQAHTDSGDVTLSGG